MAAGMSRLQPMSMTSSRIAAGDHEFHVNQSGEGSDHHVLWLHGSGPGVTAASNWAGVLEALSDDFHNIAPDMLGFADSTHPDPPPLGGAFLDLRADTMIELMDAMGVQQFDLVGNSMGAGVAAQIAHRVPDRVGRMVFMGAAAGPPAPTPGLKRISTFADDPTVENLAAILESFVYDASPWGDQIQAIAEQRVPRALRPDVMRSHAASFAPDASPPAKVDYGSLTHPSLVVHGADDQVLFLESGMQLFGLLPNAQLHVFGQCGHWVQIERADEFHTLVSSFLKGEY